MIERKPAWSKAHAKPKPLMGNHNNKEVVISAEETKTLQTSNSIK
jgi:hypothetical protein